MIQLDFGTALQLLAAFIAFASGAFVLLLTMMNKSLDKRFAAAEKARQEAQRLWETRFEEMRQLERDFMSFRAELPMRFVMREDYVRGQTVLEAKMDALYSKMEVIQMRGAQNDR